MKNIFILLGGILFFSNCIYTHSLISFKEEYPKHNSDIVIYLYQLPHFVGGAFSKYPIGYDGNLVGQLKQNAYFTIHSSPGIHQIAGCTLHIKPGEVYVFRYETDLEIYEIKNKIMCYGNSSNVNVHIDDAAIHRIFGELNSMKYDNGINVVIP